MLYKLEESKSVRRIEACCASGPAAIRYFSSDCLPDVPLQADDVITVAGECPQGVRVLEGASDANKPSEPKSKREASLRLSAESPNLTKLLRCLTLETLAAAVAND